MLSVTNNKKPVIFSDVDGTIYQDFNLKKETEIDIKFAIENGADFNICTGNPVQERMIYLANKLNARYLICSSGAEIYDVKNKKIIQSWKIDYEILLKLIEIAKKLNIQMFFWDEENYYYLKDEFPIKNEILKYHFISDEKRKQVPKKWNNEVINPIKIEVYSNFNNQFPNLPADVFPYVQNIEGIEMVLTHFNIEISPKNISKGSAIKWIVTNLYKNENVNLDDVMTIGDSNNDASMLEIGNYSYAMANSVDKPLKIAKFFTSDVIQNGLGEAILDYLYRLKNIIRKHMLHEFLEDK
ncbi:Hypothetical protein, predicted hydrolase of the HAD family [Metamycoplasma auris 15026]|uniref:Uncharacterized protein n=1 Tax=Metamycoplasma auris 15026 TaxID=1188233 RepID=N9TRD5_9BACT|nr:HAD-IIB family hydrolase [Metamycoplasma auris]ENY68714.1 Hypothetical protein, predicted hydrolase of the HAD family [Metamycoplasma auris 15026]